jgi:hypothetical protein
MNTTPHPFRFFTPADRFFTPANRFFTPAARFFTPANRFFDPARTAGPRGGRVSSSPG